MAKVEVGSGRVEPHFDDQGTPYAQATAEIIQPDDVNAALNEPGKLVF
jgi:hypothetical protein